MLDQTSPKTLSADDIGKTIGVKVKPTLYSKLAKIKESRGLKSMKEALLLAAARGADILLSDDGR